MNALLLRTSPLLLGLVVLASCEGISRAPKGSPRVELEVAVSIDSSYLDRLDGVGTDFAGAVHELVMSHSDTGLRFYGVSTDDYRPQDPRPDYRMSVAITNLEVGIDHRTVSQESQEADPVLEAFPTQIKCEVDVRLVRRRAQGPELTVGGRIRTGTAKAASRPAEGDITFGLRRGSEDLPVQVREYDLMRAIDSGMQRALQDLIPSIDRELAFRAGQ